MSEEEERGMRGKEPICSFCRDMHMEDVGGGIFECPQCYAHVDEDGKVVREPLEDDDDA